MKKMILVKILKNTWLALFAEIIVSDKGMFDIVKLRRRSSFSDDLPILPKNLGLTMNLQLIGNVPVTPNLLNQQTVRPEF